MSRNVPGGYVRIDETTWPAIGTDAGWQARYGEPKPLVLASYVDAYEALVMLPRSEREKIVRALMQARQEEEK